MTIENKVGPTLIDAPSSTLKVETNIKIDNYEVRGNKLISVGNAIINSGVITRIVVPTKALSAYTTAWSSFNNIEGG